jgi:hypothetical protein
MELSDDPVLLDGVLLTAARTAEAGDVMDGVAGALVLVLADTAALFAVCAVASPSAPSAPSAPPVAALPCNCSRKDCTVLDSAAAVLPASGGKVELVVGRAAAVAGWAAGLAGLFGGCNPAMKGEAGLLAAAARCAASCCAVSCCCSKDWMELDEMV